MYFMRPWHQGSEDLIITSNKRCLPSISLIIGNEKTSTKKYKIISQYRRLASVLLEFDDF